MSTLNKWKVTAQSDLILTNVIGKKTGHDIFNSNGISIEMQFHPRIITPSVIEKT